MGGWFVVQAVYHLYRTKVWISKAKRAWVFPFSYVLASGILPRRFCPVLALPSRNPAWPLSDFAIIIPVYNRPVALGRLLRSLAATKPAGRGATLVFSQEGDCTPEVAGLCDTFAWPHGEKQIRRHPEHLGLREHILACGDLTSEFSTVVLLEDDLCVAPGFLTFAQEAVAFYGQDERIAGISLYAFCFNELAQVPFMPLDDGYDTYFVQSASSWGQVWTRSMWRAFRAWQRPATREAPHFDVLHPAMRAWPEDSWKKLFNLYLIESDRYFVVPRRGYSTNLGEVGTHYFQIHTQHAAPLTLGTHPPTRFAPLDARACRYDAYFEIEPTTLHCHCPHLRPYAFQVDLLAQKDAGWLSAPLVLTSRPAPPSDTVLSFGLRFFPPALNMVFDEPGTVFRLARTATVNGSDGAALEPLARIRDFYRRP